MMLCGFSVLDLVCKFCTCVLKRSRNNTIEIYRNRQHSAREIHVASDLFDVDSGAGRWYVALI